MSEGISAEATWLGGLKTDITVRGHTLRVDEPASVGGEDTGPMPTEMLCVSLASCFCLSLGWVATRREIALPNLKVTVRAIQAGKEPRYERLVVTYSADIAPEDLAALALRAKRVCWVSNSLNAGIAVDYETA